MRPSVEVAAGFSGVHEVLEEFFGGGGLTRLLPGTPYSAVVRGLKGGVDFVAPRGGGV